MAESQNVPYDQLPDDVRADFDFMSKRLVPGLKFGRFMREANGCWVAVVCTPDGVEGGHYMILQEPPDMPKTFPWQMQD